ALPRPDELMPLPEASDLFLLPGRRAMGLDPETGRVEVLDKGEVAVAAFAAPAHTAAGVCSFHSEDNAPCLPLFSYCAVGFDKGRFYVNAKKVDQDIRQVFAGIPQKKIDRGARGLLHDLPDNRLAQHLAHCALTYCCPAAKNLALGRYEAPLPTSTACNAACVGCISHQAAEAGFTPPQERIRFTPTPKEIVQVMLRHGAREDRPVYSFGQGCEGEPLTQAGVIAEAVASFRAKDGSGTVNINTNGSLPLTIPDLARAGVNSLRVSLVSAREPLYTAYHRPKSYSFGDVLDCIKAAKAHNMFVSLNFLYFPGIGDCEEELEALSGLVNAYNVNYIQLRNLNMDPELFLDLAKIAPVGPSTGLVNFRKRIKKSRPGLGLGYFNPFLDEAGRPAPYLPTT
ncbi:MAG: radical SAM protein, partial [Desulfovibrio sp.]